MERATSSARSALKPETITRDSISRIRETLDKLSKFSIPVGEGITRLAFTVEETAALNWARNEIEGFGYECNYDAFSNLHAYDPREGRRRILVGTHLDSVINGGMFDGTVGFASFLEALHLLKQNGENFSLPVDLVIFRAEESTLFKVALLGSRVATGDFNLGDLYDLRFTQEEEVMRVLIHSSLVQANHSIRKSTEEVKKTLQRTSLVDVLLRNGNEAVHKIRKGCWLFRYAKEDYHAYFEIHIEQGRVLETRGIDLGIVTSFRAPLRKIFTLEGRTDHSGATPMSSSFRQDALCAASECILSIERICSEEVERGLDIVGTVGVLNIPFMSINKIPGQCWFTLDLRSNNAVVRDSVYRKIHDEICDTCDRRGVRFRELETENSKPVSLMDNRKAVVLQNEVRGAIDKLGYSHMLIPSGAGHDAMQIARVRIPVCMLFVPCENGISHSPLENAKTKDILKATNVLKYMLTQILN